MREYTVCPDCGRRKIVFRFGKDGCDFYICTRRVCQFSFYTDSGASTALIDTLNSARWRKANNMAEVYSPERLQNCQARLTKLEIEYRPLTDISLRIVR